MNPTSEGSARLMTMWDGYIAEGKQRGLDMKAEMLIRTATYNALGLIEQEVRESTVIGMATLLGKTFPGLAQEDIEMAIENVRLGIIGMAP